MNNVLELRGNRFVQASRDKNFGGPSMNGKEIVTSEKINRLKSKIYQIKQFWEEENKPFEGILISVHYNKIVAKSNRIGGIFKGYKSNDYVVGAKFNSDRSKHIITYYLNSDDLVKSIELLDKANSILVKKFNSSINNEVLKDKTKINSVKFKNYPMTQSPFKQVIADVSYIDDFEIEYGENQGEQSIVTLYDTKSDTKKFLIV